MSKTSRSRCPSRLAGKSRTSALMPTCPPTLRHRRSRIKTSATTIFLHTLICKKEQARILHSPPPQSTAENISFPPFSPKRCMTMKFPRLCREKNQARSKKVKTKMSHKSRGVFAFKVCVADLIFKMCFHSIANAHLNKKCRGEI